MRLVALALIAVLAGGCEDEQDTPGGGGIGGAAAEKAARKAECRKLEEHIVRITPRPGGGGAETDPARIQQLVAKVPIEDIEQCAALQEHKDIECMQAAGDVAALRACIPAKKK